MTVRVVCSSCKAVYNVPESRVTSDVVRATCKVCNAEIEIRRADLAEETETTGGVAPIPRDPEDKPTGTWQKAIVDNADTDRLLGNESTTLPPARTEGTVEEPTVGDEPRVPQGGIDNLGNRVITSRADLDQAFPEDDPQPPPGLGSPSAAAPARDAGKKKKKRRRRQPSRIFRLFRLFVFFITFLAVIGAALAVGKMLEIF